LGAADGDFRVLAVRHAQLVGAFEPGDDFLDVIDVDQIGAVHAPEHAGIEIGLQLFDGAVIGLALQILAHERDQPVVDRGKDEVVRVQQQKAIGAAHEELGLLGLASLQRAEQFLEGLGGAGGGVQQTADALQGLCQPLFVDGLEQVINGIQLKGLDGVLVVRGDENDVGNADFALLVEQLANQAQTVLPGKIEPGRTVTISGSGFEADPAKNTVRFGDQVGAVTAATASQIAVTVPAGLAPAGTADVPVVVERVAGSSVVVVAR